MSRSNYWTWVGIVCLLSAGAAYAQQDQAAVSGSSAAASSAAVAAVPRLIKYSGTVTDARGEPLGSVSLRLTFAVYEAQTGGAALWAENQVVELDEQGHYSVLLGATRSDGLPVELFPAGKARWLGVQVEGRDEDLRVLLVSVPYALKAEDAAKLGGRSASDFVLTEQLKEEVKTQVAAQKSATATSSVETLVSNPPNLPAITEGPSTFTCATTGDCVAVTQSGTGRALRATATSASEAALLQQNGTGYGLRVLSQNNYAIYGVVQGAVVGTTYGVRGLVNSTTGAGILGSNTATTGIAYGLMGQTSSVSGIGLYGRALSTTGATFGLTGDADSTSGKGIMGRATATSGTTMGIYAEARSAGGTALVVNNTASGKLLSAQANGVEKLSVSGSGNLASAGTLSGTRLISTVASGTAPLAVTSNTLVPSLNADLLDGVHAGGFAILGSNTFTTTQSISSGDLSVSSGNISLPQTASASAGVINLGGAPFIHAYGNGNTFVGTNAGNFTTTGSYNTASGTGALQSNTMGNSNTATGRTALYSNTTGGNNTATGTATLASNTTGSYNTASGLGALSFNTDGSYNTAIGHRALGRNCKDVSTGCTGHYNTALGYNAGGTFNDANANVTGANNTFVGALSGPGTSAQLINATAIGANALVSASNSLVLGGTGDWAVNVGIGTSTPGHRLTVAGTIESTTGGFMFPDGTTQTTAASGGGVASFNGRTGDVTAQGGDYTFGQISGVVGSSQLSGPYTNAVTFTNGAFSGTFGGVFSGTWSGSLSTSVSSGTAIYGYSTSGPGLYGGSSSWAAVRGHSTYSNGVWGDTNDTWHPGVAGTAPVDGGGVMGLAGGPTTATYGGWEFGVYGESFNESNGIGVWGVTSDGYAAVYGSNVGGSAWAGYFYGDVEVTGSLYKSANYFKIDHPLDPANKFLIHSVVESPDMKNVYDGVVVLDSEGQAWVELPEWFESLNSDFRYQLTCIGGFAPVFVAEEIGQNRFKIAGGREGLKVSWQVTGIRQDAYARAHRIQVQEEKPLAERGFYLHPELFGQPKEKGIQWAHRPEESHPLEKGEGVGGQGSANGGLGPGQR